MTVSARFLTGFPSASGMGLPSTSLKTVVLVVNIGKHAQKTRLKSLSIVSRLVEFATM